MLPQIRFFRPNDIFVTGLGVRRIGADWQYYLPFINAKARPCSDGGWLEPHVRYALALSDSRVLVATHGGDLALIDLVADQVVTRKKIKCSSLTIQVSTDRRQVFIQDAFSLFVLDATTLDIVQHWNKIERSGGGWVRYSAAENHDIERQKIKDGTLDCLHLFAPVRELTGDRLGASFVKRGHGYYGPQKCSGYVEFNIETGAIERYMDPSFRDAKHKGAPSDDPKFALECPFSPPDGPAGFQAVVIREAMVTLVVAGPGLEAALAVLDDLAGRMERDFDTLICCDSINLHFVQDGETLKADTFFGRLVQKGWVEAVPILRRLMLAYLNNIEGGEGDMPWHSGGQSLAALRALMLLDADSHDVYRLYLKKGDLEHDHAPYELYTEYLNRYGIRNEADVRFGIYLTISGHVCTDTDPSALLAGAERHVTPEGFADLVVEEAMRGSDRSWEKRGRDFVKGYVAYLGRRRPTAFTQNVSKTLTARV